MYMESSVMDLRPKHVLGLQNLCRILGTGCSWFWNAIGHNGAECYGAARGTAESSIN